MLQLVERAGMPSQDKRPDCPDGVRCTRLISGLLTGPIVSGSLPVQCVVEPSCRSSDWLKSMLGQRWQQPAYRSRRPTAVLVVALDTCHARAHAGVPDI